MQFSIGAILLLAAAPPATAFMVPGAMKKTQSSLKVATMDETIVNKEMDKRPIYDPLGLYPPSSQERRDGLIQVVSDPENQLINEMNSQRPVFDPLGLYPLSSEERRENRIQTLIESEDVVQTKTITDPMNLYPANAIAVNNQVQQELNKRPLHDPFGLYGSSSEERRDGRIQFASDTETEIVQAMNNDRPLYDPLTLYPESSEERRDNRIQALESEEDRVRVPKAVVDPLQLYPQNSDMDSSLSTFSKADMSQALPFASRPAVLDGTLVGDAGFDPLGFASNKEQLSFLRDAELKHSRIAMLAAVGWPLSELLNKYLASMTDLKPLLGLGDRVPSVLNGGLGQVPPLFWGVVVGAASLIEITKMVLKDDDNSNNNEQPMLLADGVMGMDRENLELSELKNGRIAMIAITAFAMQEFVTKMAVVNVTPFLFHPFH